MKIVIAGGTGYLGQLLSTHFLKDSNNTVFILSRSRTEKKFMQAGLKVHICFAKQYWS